MNAIAKGIHGFYYGAEPYQDHHGGGLWLKDQNGWFMVRNLAGIEWSAQCSSDFAHAQDRPAPIRVAKARACSGELIGP